MGIDIIKNWRNFYPRPPRGGRPGQHSGVECNHDISIHALREEGDLLTFFKKTLDKIISIHALREEGDVTQAIRGQRPTYFYPRPPRGGRQKNKDSFISVKPISIHALREEGDASSVH